MRSKLGGDPGYLWRGWGVRRVSCSVVRIPCSASIAGIESCRVSVRASRVGWVALSGSLRLCLGLCVGWVVVGHGGGGSQAGIHGRAAVLEASGETG